MATRSASRRRGTVIAHHDVERVGGDEVLGEIGGVAGDAGRQRRGDAGVRQLGGDQPLELGDELMHALGRQIESEQLDGDETIVLGFIGAKHRTQRARADLMKNAKWTERVGRRSTGSVRVQWIPPRKALHRNTEALAVQSFSAADGLTARDAL